MLFLIVLCSCSKTNENNEIEKSSVISENPDLNKAFNKIHKLIYENPSEARKQAKIILDSLSSQDPISDIKLLKYIGSSFVFETNYTQAIQYYDKALDIAEKINLYSEIANINNNLGVIFNEVGNYKTSYYHLIKALNYYDLSKNKEKKVSALNNIGLIFINLNNYERALIYLEQAIDPQIMQKDTILVASVLNNIALCYISQEKSYLAIEYIEESIELSSKVSNQYGLCISYQLLGSIYLKLNEYQQAFESYTLSTKIAQKSNWSYQEAMSQMGIARVLLQLGKTKDAYKIAYDAKKLAIEQKSLVLESEAYQLLSLVHEKSKEFEKSLINYKKHIEKQQEIVNQTIIHQVYNIELDDLNEINQMQQLELEKKELAISKKNNLLIFGSLLSLFLFIGLYLLYLNHRHRQKVKLQKTIIELTEKKSNAALEAEIQERKRIGEELHDSIGHLLSLAGLNASVLYKRKDISEDKRKELLESLMKSINDAFTELRNISHNLAPSLLSEQGLKGALKSISDKINQSGKLYMNFDTYGLTEKLDALLENTLYRIIQEIVNNTIKHANATKLFIQITQGNNEISLIAEDNGKGFDVNDLNNTSNFGLMHMKSRIENLKGSLFIDSNINRGTIISVLLPL